MLNEVIVTGESGQWLYPILQAKLTNTKVSYIKDLATLFTKLTALATANTAFAFKGSRSAHMERGLLRLSQNIQTQCHKTACPKLIHCKECDEF